MSRPENTAPSPARDNAAMRQPSAAIEHRDLSSADVARSLRAIVGLPPPEPASCERAAWAPGSEPQTVERVDVLGWIVWCLAGLELFAREFPTAAQLRLGSRRAVYGLVMHRSRHNISEAARVLGTSRKALRDNLRALGLYRLPGMQREGHDDGPGRTHSEEPNRR